MQSIAFFFKIFIKFFLTLVCFICKVNLTQLPTSTNLVIYGRSLNYRNVAMNNWFGIWHYFLAYSAKLITDLKVRNILKKDYK